MIFGIYLPKNLLFSLLIGLLSLQAAAQDNPTTADVPDTTIKVDSTRDISILIIPYNPKMYFSDADKDISETSKMEKGKVNRLFSGSLEKNLDEHLGLYYKTQSISKQPDAEDELDLIFGSINYSPEEIQQEKESADKAKGKLKKLGKRLKNKLKQERPDEKDPAKTNGERNMYMDITFDDNRLLTHLQEKYKSEYFLFINQFEVVTDYENCIDLQLRKYYREIKVHYSLFSKSGEKLSGKVITLPYHSNENDISAIIRDNFSLLSNEMLNQIYLKK